jgi:hypothetical protein
MSKIEKEQILVRYGGSRKEREEFLRGMINPEGKPEVLNDVTVLDVSYANLSGDICSSIFAEFGAEVIKIEPPEGDPSRKITPYGVNRNGVGVPFIMEARNKRYFTLDLKTEEGRRDLKSLAAKAQIVIETYAPGTMDSWGVGYRQLAEINPGLVYIAISPYGQYGEKAKEFINVPDSDITAQAISGVCANIGDMPGSGEPYNWPLRAGVWLSWYISGITILKLPVRVRWWMWPRLILMLRWWDTPSPSGSPGIRHGPGLAYTILPYIHMDSGKARMALWLLRPAGTMTSGRCLRC